MNAICSDDNTLWSGYAKAAKTSSAGKQISGLLLVTTALVLGIVGVVPAKAADDCSSVATYSYTQESGYFLSPNLAAGETVFVQLDAGTFKITNPAHTTTYETVTGPNGSGTSWVVPTNGQYALYYSGGDSSDVLGCGIASTSTITTASPYAVTPPAPYDFGSVALPDSAANTLIFAIPGDGQSGDSIASVSVVTMGAPNLDFTESGSDNCVGKSLASASTCAVAVQFAPLRAGWRKGGVLLKDSSGKILSVAYVQGIGVGGELAFQYGSPVAFSSVPKAYSSNAYAPYLRLTVDGNGVLWEPASGGLNYDRFSSPFSSTPAPTAVSSGLAYPGYDSELGVNYDGTTDPNALGTIASAVDGAGNVYISGEACDCDGKFGSGIMRIDPSGNASVFYSYTVPDTGTTPLGIITSLAVGGDGSIYAFSSKYATGDTGAGANKLDPYTSAITNVTPPGLSFRNPFSAAIDSAGNLYVADGDLNHTPSLYKISGANYSNLNIGTTLGNPGFFVSSIAIDSLDNLFVASLGSDTSRSNLIYVVPVANAANPYTISAVAAQQFHAIGSLALDAQDNLYVQDLPKYNSTSSDARTIYYFPLKSPGATSFAAQPKGTTSAPQTLTLTNIGNAALAIQAPTGGSNPTISSTDFTLVSNSDSNSCQTSSSVTVPSGDVCARFGTCSSITANSCTIKVASSPHVASGGTSGTIDIAANLSSSQSSLNLSGSGAPGVVSLGFTGLPTAAAAGAAQRVTVTALDGSSATLTGYTGTVHFSLTNSDPGATLPSDYTFTSTDGGSKQFTVILSAVGAQTLTVTDTANGLSANQNTMVVSAVNHFAFTAAPPTTTTAGNTFSVTVTAYSSTDASQVATSYTGPVKFTSSDSNAVLPTTGLTLTNGVGTFSITLKTAGAQTITVADSGGSPSVTSSEITVDAGAANAITVVSGGTQSATIGAGFGSPLAIQVVDSYSNPISGSVVTFTAPSSGASATLSASTCTTSATTPVGQCSVTATANGISNSVTSYTITAKVAGVTTGANFTLTNNEAVTTISTTPTAASIVYGQPVTLNAAISPATAGGSSPTGSVTFYDGIATALAPNATVASANASYTASLPPVGTHTYYAKYLGDTNFSASSQTAATSNVVVGKASSTLTGPTTQPVLITQGQNGTVGITVSGQFSGTSIAKPSGSISYNILDSSNATVGSGTASISSGAANIPVSSSLAVGSYQIQASYAGDANYAAATSINVSLQIGQLAQTITFMQPTSPVSYGFGPITLAATGGASGNPVTFSIVSGANAGSLSGPNNSILTITGVGTIVVAANQAGNTTYAAATQVTQTVVVNQASQAITFTPPASPVTYGASPIALQATGGASGNPVTFSIVSGSSYGSLSGANNSTLRITGVGTIVIAANQAASADYSAATQVTQTVVVNQAGQAITFTPPASPVTYGTSPIALQATGGGSGNPVTFSIVSGSSFGSLSGVNNSILTVTGAGSITIAANQAGDANYSAATQVTQSIVVTQASQTIIFPAPPSPVTYGISPIGLSATGGASGNPVTFSIVSGTNGTLSGTDGSMLTISGAGTLVIAANQAGNSNYSAARQVSRTIVVNKASQAISFTPPVSPVTYGVSPISLFATGGASGQPVTFSILSGTNGSLTGTNGSTLTVTGAGTLVIAANQTGTANYTAAAQVTQTLVVNQASQSITFTAPAAATFGTAPLTLSASGGASGNPVTFSILSGSAFGSLSGTDNAMLTITGAGSIVIAASQAGNANYLAAPQVTQTVVVNQAAQRITFTPPSSVTYGIGSVSLSATGGASGNPITFAVTSGPATLAGNSLSIKGAGIVNVTANQAGNANYAAATAVSASILVNKADTSIQLSSSINPVLVQNSTTLAATVNSSAGMPTGSVTFMDGATPLSTVSIAGGIATLSVSTLAVGTHSITAIYSGDNNFVTALSAAISEQVQDFNLAISTSSGTGSVTTQTVVPGATATYSFIVSPTGTATFPAAVALSVSGLPPGATYTINPTSIAAGSGSTPVTLAVSMPNQAANGKNPDPFGNPGAPLTFAVLLLPFARRLRKTSRRLRRIAMLSLLLVGSAIAMAGLSGCGARTGFFAQPQQSYTVTITGSAGSDSHSTSVTLIVE